jgi:hypothetical protein
MTTASPSITPRIGERYRWAGELVTVKALHGVDGRVLVEAADGQRAWAPVDALTEQFFLGAAVGWRGLWARVCQLSGNYHRVRIEFDDGEKVWVEPHRLQPAPPPPPEVEAAGRELAPFLSDPRMIFGQGAK